MSEPPITLRAKFSSFTAGDNGTPTRVVIHATCPSVGYPKATAPGAAHGTALYFASGNAGGSAHYVCGVDGEEHCVPENTIAYHAPPNGNSIGIEITAEGGTYALNYTRDQWLSPQVWPAVQRAAARTRDLCQRYGIPMVQITAADLLAGKHGICSHNAVSLAWHQSTHSDPGDSTFPWAEFIALVKSGAPAPTPPEDIVTPQDIAAISDAVANRMVGPEGAAWQEWNTAAAQAKAAVAAVQALSAKVDALAAAVAKMPTGGGTMPAACAMQGAVLAPKPA